MKFSVCDEHDSYGGKVVEMIRWETWIWHEMSQKRKTLELQWLRLDRFDRYCKYVAKLLGMCEVGISEERLDALESWFDTAAFSRAAKLYLNCLDCDDSVERFYSIFVNTHVRLIRGKLRAALLIEVRFFICFSGAQLLRSDAA